MLFLLLVLSGVAAVAQELPVPCTASIIGPSTRCSNRGSIQLGATITPATTTGTTYRWSTSTSATTQSISVEPLVQTTYTVTVTNSNCPNGAIARKTVIVYGPPTASISGNLNLCNNGTTTLTAQDNEGYNYSWSNGISGNQITNIGAGTYTVTVTANGCSSTASATVLNRSFSVEDYNIVSPTTSSTYDLNTFGTTFCPDNREPVYITPILDNTVSNHIYQYKWVLGSNTGTANINTGNNATFHLTDYTQGQIYTVLVTDVTTGCTATGSLTIPTRKGCCSNNNPNIITIGMDRSSVTTLSSVLSIGNNAANLPNSDLIINGTLKIDQNYGITGQRIYMCEGASIEVLNGVTFQLGAVGSSTLSVKGMGVMWNSIIVKSGGRLTCGTSLDGHLYINDAYRAFTLEKGGILEFGKRTFVEDCYTGIYIPPCPSCWNDCQLTSDGGRIAGTRDLMPFTFMRAPIGAARSRVGIELNDVSSTRFLASPPAGQLQTYALTLSNLQYGVILNNTTIKINNALDIQNCQSFIAGGGVGAVTNDAFAGTGISIANNSNIAINGAGNGSFFPLAFKNNNTGVRVANSNATIQNLSIDQTVTAANWLSNIGIDIRNCQAKSLTIQNNVIKANINGIFCYQNPNSRIILGYRNATTGTITPNMITMLGNTSSAAQARGIRVSEGATNTTYRISNNNISFLNLGYAGIDLNGIQGNAQCASNTINGTTMQHGIYAANTTNSTISGNTITGGSTNLSNGILLDRATNATIECNTLNNTRAGIVLQNIVSTNAIRTNNMGNHKIGLDYTTTVTSSLGDQINAGNKFTGNYTIAAARNQAAYMTGGVLVVLGQIYTNQYTPQGQITQFWGGTIAKQMIGLNTVQDWFTPTTAVQPVCVNLTGENDGNLTTSLTTEEATALGLYATPEYPNEMAWAAQKALYSKLVEHPDFVENSTILEDFQTDYEQTNTADLVALELATKQQLTISQQLEAQLIAYKQQIESIENSLNSTDNSQQQLLQTLLAATLDAYKQTSEAFEQAQAQTATTLAVQNAAIVPIKLQEVNAKTIAEVYYRTAAKGEPVTDNLDKLVVQFIAAQCPYTGGEAVFVARSLADDEAIYDNTAICANQGVNYRTQKPVVAAKTSDPIIITAKAYPNPASNFVVVETNAATSEGVVIVTDMLGKIVQVSTWQTGQTKQLIQLQGISSGIYSLKLHTADQDFILGKLTIVQH